MPLLDEYSSVGFRVSSKIQFEMSAALLVEVQKLVRKMVVLKLQP